MKDGTHWWIRLIEMTLLKSPKRRENLNITIKKHQTECAQHNIHFPFTALWPPNKRGIQLKKISAKSCNIIVLHACLIFASLVLPVVLFLPECLWLFFSPRFPPPSLLFPKTALNIAGLLLHRLLTVEGEKKVKCSFELGAHYSDNITPAVSS